MADHIANADHRYVSLDGMRGLAAIAVAIFHLDASIVPGGYLAVDFFFVLSGFVLRRAYQSRIETGLTVFRFMLLRLIRLYPLYLVGILFGIGFSVQGAFRGVENSLSFDQIRQALFFNILMLPSPFGKDLFPLNAPSWSLFSGILANIALAIILIGHRKSIVLLTIISAISLIAAEIFLLGTPAGIFLLSENVGVGAAGAAWSEWPVGIARTAFSFFVGMTIAGYVSIVDTRTDTILFIPLVIMLLGTLCVPIRIEYRFIYDIIIVIIVFPLIITFGSRIGPIAKFAPGATFLGEISFALYAIHMPLAHIFQFIARKIELANTMIAPIYVLTALLISWACVKFIDVPARRVLKGLFSKTARRRIQEHWML